MGGREGKERDGVEEEICGVKWKTRGRDGTWEVEGGVECVRELGPIRKEGEGRGKERRKRISAGGGKGGMNGGGDMEECEGGVRGGGREGE